ncbi:hypothetical protein [Cellulomonas sp. HZM]|uniref:hypothetical protein n=1 Tax=Cellulomonas sp. HZM TaxID=1454010 RepID=UPI00068CB2EC|nr:hypothetical protein [Cellulomonas sp. HZM]
MDTADVDIGEFWVYRTRDSDPSQRVRVRSVHHRKRGSRVEVEFLDGADAGQVRNVPGRRLRVPWSQVETFDARMAALDRLEHDGITEVESSAVEAVYNLLLPAELAWAEWTPVHWATRIPDPERFADDTGLPLASIVQEVANTSDEDGLLLSPHGSMLIAAALCRANTEAVLSHVDSEERVARHKCANGGAFRPSGGRSEPTSAQWEWQWYLESTRPLLELLREWCGHRAVTVHERLVAAESEVARLDELVSRLVDTVRTHGDELLAETFAREHIDEQVTPYNVRTLVERPLSPAEIPVSVEYRRRPRWS